VSKRLQLANEGAIRENIRKFLELLSTRRFGAPIS
jgi:hypothetical protein